MLADAARKSTRVEGSPRSSTVGKSPRRYSFKLPSQRGYCPITNIPFRNVNRCPDNSRSQRPSLHARAANAAPNSLPQRCADGRGLWDEWKNRKTGELLKSRTVIITGPNGFAAQIHDRMPAFLTEAQFASCLSGQAGAGILKPGPNVYLQRWPVSKRSIALRQMRMMQC